MTSFLVLVVDKKWKLFICRGEINTEAALLEVSCNIKQLRSRASFVLVNVDTGVLYVWHGCKVTKAASEACSSIVDNLKTNCPPELGLKTDTIVEVTNVKEGSEPKEFFNGIFDLLEIVNCLLAKMLIIFNF